MKTDEITIQVDNDISLKGNLTVPSGANALVIFSHESESSRLSHKNKEVAEILNKEKIATLLTDLLTEKENASYENSFDTDLLAAHLVKITNYVMQIPNLKNLKIGYFGAATGSGAALKAASHKDASIQAIVSRGGRPNLSEEDLTKVKAPTLLIVGSLDDELIEFNQWAYKALQCEKKMEVIEGASHLLEEPGKLEEVAKLATNWFVKHLHPNPLLTA
jgi:putative phosphoribosyl transferase